MFPNDWMTKTNIIVSVIFLIIFANTVAAADNQYSLAPYVTITTGDGEPAHDIPRMGLKGRYLLNRNLYLTMTMDYTKFDFERPYKLLGIDSTNEIDAKVSGMIFGAGAEREFSFNRLIKPYVGAGIGVTFISADDITGKSPNGDAFDISTDTGTEFIPYVNGGVRWMFWRNLSLDLGTRFEYHVADWVVTDRASRLSNSIDDYFQYGGYIGIGIAF